MGRSRSTGDNAGKAGEGWPASRDIRDAPMYQLAMLASLSDRKGQAAFSAQFGLSLGEWRALANIAIQEPVSLADLSRDMMLDKGQLSRTVQRLVQRGWVSSHAMPGNRGALTLTVTAEGRERYAALMKFTEERNAKSMSVLTPDERRAFMHCIGKLRAHMERLYVYEFGGQAGKQATNGCAEDADLPMSQAD